LNAITGAFTPILMTLRDGYFARAAQELGIQFLPGTESDSFLTEYLGAMQHRATQWNDADKEIAEAELQRACKAFRVAGYREAASMKANEGRQA